MNLKIYNKLVRDNIPQIMVNNGASPVTRILSDEEYISELNRKILEEVHEYLESGEVEELADIEEVLRAILTFKGVNLEEFDSIRNQKVLKRGAFNKRIFLEREE